MMSLDYREDEFVCEDNFPKIGLQLFLRSKLQRLKSKNPHDVVTNCIQELASGSHNYHWFYESFSDRKFDGHSHQSSPILAVYLASLGLDVNLLKCYEVVERGSKSPAKPSKKFENIGHNPFSIIEANFWNSRFLISPKHLNESLVSLLHPESHRELTGTLAHPEDPDKSGIYLKNFNTNWKEAIWLKKDYKTGKEKYFRAYLRSKVKV